MADEQQAVEKKSRFDLKFLVIGLILLTLAGAISFGVAYLVASKSNPKPAQKTEKSVDEHLGPIMEAGEYTTNIAGSGNHFLQVKVVLVLNNEKGVEEATEKLTLLQHNIILVLRSKDLEALSDILAQEKLGEEMKISLNKYLKKGRIEKVLVNKFLLQ